VLGDGGEHRVEVEREVGGERHRHEAAAGEGAGATTVAPGFAVATEIIAISSSEPLPTRTSAPAGTPSFSRISCFRRAYDGAG
jgi:hypothetical protein